MLGVGVIKDGDAVAIGDFDHFAGEDMDSEWLLAGLLLSSCGFRLTRLAVLVVRAVVAVACIPTDISAPVGRA